MDPFLHTLDNIHSIESTLDEELSYHYLSSFTNSSLLFYKYSYPDLLYSHIRTLVNEFTCFCSSILDFNSGRSYTSPVPLQVFRYLMLEDGSWSNYYSRYNNSGYVVEGAHWSNGLFYQVRQDSRQPFETYEVNLYIDSLTKTMYNFPEV